MNFSIIEQIILTVLILSTFSIFFYEIWRRLRIINKGRGKLPFDYFSKRMLRVFKEVILQKRVIQGRFWPGLMHGLVFWGFIVFSIVTLDHFATGFERSLFSKSARHLYTFIATPFAWLVIIGIVALAYRRFISRPESLGKLSLSSGLVAIFIFILMATYLYGETTLPYLRQAGTLASKINWWLHSLVILAFLSLIPKSKHLHLVFAPFNIFFRPFDTPEHIPTKIDLEASEEEMDQLLQNLTRLSKNQAFDIFSCVECGRCTEVCPAHRGGGILDPKNHFILDLRDPLLNSKDVSVLGQINVEAGWECTSCQACTYACPVGNQVEKSDEIRALQVLVEGKVPQEYQKLFMNLQESGNTEGAFHSSLAEKLPEYTPDKDYLLWLGCFARFEIDPSFTKAVTDFTKILDKAGVTYGVEKDEWCCGDPANKLGDRMTYQFLIDHNLEFLSKTKKITTLCPHCMVNLDKEYRKFSDISYVVEHHTQVIATLIKENRIQVKPNHAGPVTFHDPCYLSRIIGEVDVPRELIKATTKNFFELEEHGSNTLCCGAGGGLWWKKEGTGRTHLIRAQQIVDSGCETVVTACNFCFGMFNQGLGPLTPEDQKPIEIKDIAEFVQERLT
ncbi:MAG: 4Fe-4S dicluster domain-containing protein [Candidatus Marinimicrobia bacterium]|nr:4Fe-4S dicluster domain-containing protein [Candidatus Neomarinimicrobiota bacterium]